MQLLRRSHRNRSDDTPIEFTELALGSRGQRTECSDERSGRCPTTSGRGYERSPRGLLVMLLGGCGPGSGEFPVAG